MQKSDKIKPKLSEILFSALKHNQEMINFADTKANIALTVQSLIVTIGIASSLITDTFSLLNNLKVNSFGIFISYIIFFIIYSITSLVGTTISIFVFIPRGVSESKEEKRKGIFFFEHIKNYGSSVSYYNRIMEISDEDLQFDFASQIYQLAKIADKKMNIVKKAIWGLLINIILTIAFLLFTVCIHLVGI